MSIYWGLQIPPSKYNNILTIANMKEYRLTNVTDGATIGTYPTKLEAIEAMNEEIEKTNGENGETEEEGLTPFDFKLETVEVDEARSITTFHDAQEFLGLSHKNDFFVVKRKKSKIPLELRDIDAFVQDINPHHFKALVALNKLFTLAEAWNKADGFVPDFTDRKQRKYFPWFGYDDETAGFVYMATEDVISYMPFGSRLCFKTESRAKEFGKKFASLYNEVFTITKQGDNEGIGF